MTKTTKKIGTSGQAKQFTHEELDVAVMSLFDIMGRLLLDTLFIPLGEFAQSINEGNEMHGDGLDVGIERRYLTPDVLNALKILNSEVEMPNLEITDKGFSYEAQGVPVRVKFIERKYGFFKNPDVRMYMTEEFRMPNPFDAYWKVRSIVQ